MNCKVNFGIIPCGSGNGLAYTAGIPKQPEKALELIFLGKAHAIDGFTVNDQFACMLSGLGFDARVAHEFARQPKRGLATYARQVFKHFIGAGTYNFTIATKEKKFTTAAYLISIANSNQFGNNVKIAPKASLTDGLLDVVIVTSQNKISLLIQTIRQLGGFIKVQSLAILDETRSIIYFQTDKLFIENLSEAPLHIDGDPAETPDSLDIKICKQCFHLIQPA
jgi:diacylglycerol kinase family enzyme